MHQKKSEPQIGTDSTGISSDFNPNPIISSSIGINFPHKSPVFHSISHSNNANNNISYQHHIKINDFELDPFGSPHKRPLFSHTRSPLLSNPFTKSPVLLNPLRNLSKTHCCDRFRNPKAAAFRLLGRFQTRIRLVLLLSLPGFYFLVSHPSRWLVVDFVSAFAFSSALLFSLNLALPRLPWIRLFPIKLYSSRRYLSVFWLIGLRRKGDKRAGAGCWVQAYSNGDVYEGEFDKGKCWGCGVYYYYMSGRYEGDWVDGKYDGYGMETWARGSRYRGQYVMGLRHGFGVYRFYTGDVYAGEWLNGQSHGCGVHTCEDGSRYVGEFKWGVKHGLGHYHFRNGDTYAGEYFADKMHGFGVYRFANGHRYEGTWHEGKRQGLGMYTFKNGETQSGHWQNGELDIPSSQSAMYPVSPVAVYHSKVLNAIQEARRAAEKAYDVAKVDERVNRAVAAANRAANAAKVAAVKAVQKQMHRMPNRDGLPIPVVRNFHHLSTRLSV
ncbi:putative 1-phosphatidylinositol-4-phosphate 5-kinase [Helianthus annuus]|nr:putative 1-phosphatidylinositol-4-phosphate 5-kinase [Helianthus annuus]KAJ0686573.1 putative 1-phosphatidylinositol-4-phosphate 5-kinase [Helianthus annuus]KAJ0690388.1 putative 1-phosphatidylinositol-4-phosphate 5-kinase [Helianthus annuus]KAJ0871920.1 putative 1-phosphatidylinositol-4-phosphate 5-kinase [Helianthus annuus]